MSGPLQGITVIEMAGIGPGPFCGMLLADLGADVICIQRKPGAQAGSLDQFKGRTSVVDRGRRSLALDLKDPAAIELVLQLVDKADALIEGYRPGVMERLGLGPEVCHARNPALVFGRMTGWGQTGPLARVAGHDINYIALTGALHAIGPRDQPPVVPLNLVGDYGGGGMLLAFGLVSALLHAQRSGEGQVVDAAMCDGAATLMAMLYGLQAGGQWQSQREANFLDGAAPFYSTYACADGKYIAIGAIEPQFYQLLLNKLALDDPRLSEQWRQSAWPEQRRLLAALFSQQTRDHWCELLEESDVCFAPVLDMSEAPRHAHNQARGTFTKIDGVTQPAPAPRFSRTPGAIRHGVVAPGQHSQDILSTLGMTAGDIEALVRRGVVHVHQ
ncbi:acyl-CoA transferase/carnitine dehydratase [Alcanivorax sp. S71-1-4]|uniref:CaiB/BaiF CoA transferase family protein n=1 Tax=Alcanivorax sp. S71-1-4 TaxID=1177159 RepID=UPI001358315E|nr:CaiB/BaiF CoA-transferase family protein [Alcanivorax sp. S71-1-4]KAF0809985.1 acyl-CoA transferase/carnitine dehydratase [Alcanivorax sp. S71-1-4]